MKLTITPGMIYGDRRCVRVVAVIAKSRKQGIPRRYQKTWTMKTVAPEFTVDEMRPAAEAEAKRWEEKVMAKIAAELIA